MENARTSGLPHDSSPDASESEAVAAGILASEPQYESAGHESVAHPYREM